MKTFNLKIVNEPRIVSAILIDGKQVKERRGVYSVATENNYVNVKIFTVNEMQSPVWWLVSILYFIISIFGIFDRYSRFNSDSVKVDVDFNLTEGINDATIKFLTYQEQGPAVEIIHDDVNVVENVFYTDEISKARHKKSKIIKLVTFFAILITIVLLIVLL